MAVAIDSTLVGVGNGNGVNSYALSGFSTGGTNRLVLVMSDESQAASTITSVTATGLTFTKILSQATTGGGQDEIWGAWAAAQQTNVVITINFTGSNFPQCAGQTLCLSGTDLTGTVAAAIGATGSNTANGTGPSQAVTTTRANSLVVALMGQQSNRTLTAGASQTLQGTQVSAGGVSGSSAVYQNAVTASASTSVTMSGTWSGGAINYSILALEVLAPLNPSSKFPPPNALRPHAFSPGLAR
jgi:hypothetical protein